MVTFSHHFTVCSPSGLPFNSLFLIPGHAKSFDDVIIEGDVDEQKFTAYYVKGDRVLAVATMGPGNACAKAANLMFEGKMPSGSEIKASL